MRLPDAIEIVTDFREQEKALLGDEFAQATALLIEAGKRCQLARKETSFVGPGLLPGETRE